ncbi:MAG: CHASE3 domain-containing protein [Hyphomonadaceae bacterium]
MTVNVLGRRLPATATYAAALGAALLLLVLTVGAAFWQTAQTATANTQVRHAFEQRGHYRALLISLMNGETAQRGYLLTGEQEYLEPLAGVSGAVERALAALAADAANEPAMGPEVARLRELSLRKIDELTQTIALRQSGRANEALAIVESDAGKALMDEVRAIIAGAEERARGQLIESLAASDRAAARLRFVILAAGLLILGIGALLFVTVRGAMAELRASRDEAQSINVRLTEEMEGREQAESKVRQMQKMEAIGQLTGGVAHDFNNMLAVIISALQLAQRRLQRNETGAERFLDAAMDGARRAAILTSRLLAFARRTPLSPSVIDVNRLLTGMSQLLHRTLGEPVQLEMVQAGGLWRVLADAGELENAILNICVNARDAMPAGGKLTIESANAYLDAAYAAENAEVSAGQYVMVAITDTGQGMSEDIKAKAFEPFFTTKEIGKGTGLGLSQVHGFLKQSGGHVAIYSEIGHGTTVKLYLPRTQLSAPDAPQPDVLASATSEDLPGGDPATLILLVEDDERVRNLSVTALRELGYSVMHASSGAQALDVLRQHPTIALLFTDIVMAEMNGRVLADEARKLRPDLKVLFTTGYTQNAIVHNGIVDADARLLLKPYTLKDLATKVRAALDA